MKYVCFILLVIMLGGLAIQGTAAQTQDVIVPNVEGVKVYVAGQILRTAGLQPRILSTSDPAAIVVSQHPLPGFPTSLGSEVSLSTRVLQMTPQGVNTNLPVTTSGTGATVQPSSNWSHVSGMNTIQTQRQAGQSTILYQAPQPTKNPYFVANTEARCYPAWYPRQFAAQVSTQQTASTQSVQNTVSSTTTRTAPIWYPHAFAPQSQSTTTQRHVGSGQVYTQSTMTSQATRNTSVPVLPVPPLLRLSRQDAVAAITKAGFTVGNMIPIQATQVPSGYVAQQSPSARSLVASGTSIHLWIAE